MPKELKVVALVATYNEEDIIGLVIEDLLANGVQVVILDDGSTDETLARVEPFLGKGVISVERLPRDPERGGEFSLERIITRKQELAQEMDATWFINHDADEFRESFWPRMSLLEGISLVDGMGYNAVDFAVYDFWPTHDGYKSGDDPRELFPYCEQGSQVDRLQIRCWKKLDVPLDLVSSAGHEAIFPGATSSRSGSCSGTTRSGARLTVRGSSSRSGVLATTPRRPEEGGTCSTRASSPGSLLYAV